MKDLLKKSGVVGVGWGFKRVNAERTDQFGYVVLVRKKVPVDSLSVKDVVPKTVGGFTTDVIEVGDIKALAAQAITGKMRPAQPGCSIGHYQITAGTFGCVVRDSQGNRMILSNNHVLANSNVGKLGDAILQPGAYDGGKDEDTIAYLKTFIPIQFNTDDGGVGNGGNTCQIAPAFVRLVNRLCSIIRSSHRIKSYRMLASSNLCDAALAVPTVDTDIIDDVLQIGPISGVSDNAAGMSVHKTGRTTEHTSGEVLAIGTTINVQYGEGQIATFTEQCVSGPMSQGGDSGSLIATEKNEACGLLFAGSDQATIYSPIKTVFDLLGVTL